MKSTILPFSTISSRPHLPPRGIQIERPATFLCGQTSWEATHTATWISPRCPRRRINNGTCGEDFGSPGCQDHVTTSDYERRRRRTQWRRMYGAESSVREARTSLIRQEADNDHPKQLRHLAGDQVYRSISLLHWASNGFVRDSEERRSTPTQTQLHLDESLLHGSRRERASTVMATAESV